MYHEKVRSSQGGLPACREQAGENKGGGGRGGEGGGIKIKWKIQPIREEGGERARAIARLNMVHFARGYNNEGTPLRSRDRHAIVIPSKLHPRAGKGGMCLAEITVNHAERALTPNRANRIGSDRIGFPVPTLCSESGARLRDSLNS